MEDGQDDRPMFSAVSSSARQLYMLLRCVNFSNKCQVQLSSAGLRFAVEELSVMEGFAFIKSELFTTFQFNPPLQRPISPFDQDSTTGLFSDPEEFTQTFEISLPSLLETLQIFGLTDISTRPNPWSHSRDPTSAFDNRVLGITGLCRLSYERPGAPLLVIIEESGITTTCELTTYEPQSSEDIPFARDALSLKIIMRASWLYDALSELAATNPDVLTITASPTAPYFSLSASGPLGSAVVACSSKDKALLETFQVAPVQNEDSGGSGKVVNSYKFALIKAAQRAMAAATKVSIRGDEQGVLSLQFMIEVDTGKISFVDFRLVPLAEGEDEDGSEGEGEEADDGMSEL